MPDTFSAPRHPIRIAAQRSGITPDTLRAWERRYGAVTPARSGTARRLYSDADIERLRTLRTLVDRGHSIGYIASLRPAEVAALLEAPEHPMPPRAPHLGAAAAKALESAERALAAFDGPGVRRVLQRAMMDMDTDGVIEHVMAPLCRSVGSQWEAGAICTAHEHVASAALRDTLGSMLEVLHAPSADRRLVVATPAGERHEFGAMMAAAVASSAGFQVTYLGPDLPARDIATAASQVRAHAVLLSIVRGMNAAEVIHEVEALGAAMDDATPIMLGGSGAHDAARGSAALDAVIIEDFAHLRAALAGLAGD
ncbi:MAG: MerR family transcriptional regulator [Gemmatimonadaceae bacterium]|nr:MerR family transcriptional regulator [Gemmatimonadaceae bacterium]